VRIARGDAVSDQVDDVDHGQCANVRRGAFEQIIQPSHVVVLGPLLLSFDDWERRRLGRAGESLEDFVDFVSVADHGRKPMEQSKAIFHAQDDSGEVLLQATPSLPQRDGGYPFPHGVGDDPSDDKPKRRGDDQPEQQSAHATAPVAA
jgi:hypothetical protein